jgi:hypothetical protein
MSDLGRLADDYNAIRRERDELRERLEEREVDMHARIRAGYDSTIAHAWRAALAKVEAERDKALSDLDALRVELLEVQHEIGEAWFAGGVNAATAVRRKTAALERLSGEVRGE